MKNLLLVLFVMASFCSYGQSTEYEMKELQGEWTNSRDTTKFILIKDSSWTFFDSKDKDTIGEEYLFKIEVVVEDKIIYEYIILYKLTSSESIKFEINDLFNENVFFMFNVSDGSQISYKRKNKSFN
jgi:hypothetical protein